MCHFVNISSDEQSEQLTLDDLRSLLENNEIKNFDPVAEAFRVYTPPYGIC